MDEIATIQIKKDSKTNKYIIEYIRLDEVEYGGFWQVTNQLSEEEVNKIYKLLEENTNLHTIDDWIKRRHYHY